MESLQIAQIIADLQTLQNAEPAAATALLAASKSLNSHTIRRKSLAAVLPDPPKFDKLGRRILTASSGLTSPGATGTSTPVTAASEPAMGEEDEDMQRAATLLELVEMKGKFKQMGDTGLTRAKQRVDAVIARYAAMELEEKEKAARLKRGDA